MYFKLKRSRKEIERLHVKIVRLRTFMEDKELDLERAVKETAINKQGMAHQFRLQLRHLQSVNQIHRDRLAKLFKDSRYTGPKGLGIREGREREEGRKEEWRTDVGSLCSRSYSDEEDESNPEEHIDENDAVFTALSNILPLDA